MLIIIITHNFDQKSITENNNLLKLVFLSFLLFDSLTLYSNNVYSSTMNRLIANKKYVVVLLRRFDKKIRKMCQMEK